MLTLAIDAATYEGSVAVLRDSDVVAERTTPMRGAHEERLMPAVAAALAEANIAPAVLDRIVCGAGPGSFTSLRIAGAIAKGMAAATGRPLFAVSSLVLLVAAEPREPGAYLAVLGALRGELFVQRVSVSARGVVTPDDEPALIAEDALGPLADAEDRRAVGPSTAMPAVPHARGVARIAPAAGLVRPVDLVAWEPLYGRVAEAQARWEAAHGRPLSHG